MIRAAVVATLLATSASAQDAPAIQVQAMCSGNRLAVIRLVVPPSNEPTQVTIPIPPGTCALQV